MTIDIAFWAPDEHQQVYCVDRHFVLSPGARRLCKPIRRTPSRRNSPTIEVEVSLDGRHLCLTNHGCDQVTEVWSGHVFAPGGTCEFLDRCLLHLPPHYVELRLRRRAGAAGMVAKTILDKPWSGRAPSSRTLASWFRGLGLLQRAAANSPEFYGLAARSIVQPGGLDRGMVLWRPAGKLQIAASAQCDPRLGLTYCPWLVDQALHAGQTVVAEFLPSNPNGDPDAVVVAPIFGPADRAIGAVYGVRSLRAGNQRNAIRPLEALWLQLVADAVGAGIQRLAAESQAARTRLMFEQAFSAKLVDELLCNPEILKPQKREISVLFCDLRDSTRLSNILTPEQMYQLLGDLLEHLTTQVTNSGGVIIDYYGDGLAAMWNAPHEQTDHALRACAAALNMIRQVDMLSRKYRSMIGQPLRLGIGIHTDVAYVGNAGSRQRLKYGPRGSMVSLASRLENLTKDIRPRVVISRGTQRKVAARARTRFLCQARLPGIVDPVEIHELQAVCLPLRLQTTGSSR